MRLRNKNGEEKKSQMRPQMIQTGTMPSRAVLLSLYKKKQSKAHKTASEKSMIVPRFIKRFDAWLFA
jgi:hypothetical protein